MNPATTRPARGTRPVNRRELIVAAANELFYEDGFAVVGMSDIADAVAVGPSALYRHFRSKQQLLEAVVTDMIETSHHKLDDMVYSGDPLSLSLATNALAQRRAAVLWRREARQLDATTREVLQNRVGAYYRRIGALIAAQRADLGRQQNDLLAHCAIGVAASLSFHRLELPVPEFLPLIDRLVGNILGADVPTFTPLRPVGPARPNRIGSRREHLLAAAIKLFSRDGFTQVTMEDIGAEVGISGPSVYNHFANKDDILLAAFNRGAEWLRIDMNRALTIAVDAEDAIHRLIASYREFAFNNPSLVRLVLTEIVHVPTDERERMRAVQNDYISEWVRAVHEIRPEWTPLSIRIRVQALLGMLNEVAQTALPRQFDNLGTATDSIAWGLLTQ